MSGEGSAKNVVLIGFMGSGKTSVGERLAGEIGYNFKETDTLVAEEAGESVADIFKTKGEDTFREFEKTVIGKLADGVYSEDGKGLVVAVGGGANTDIDNRIKLKDIGTIIWLKCSLVKILERVSYGDTRSLLENVTGEESVVDLVRTRSQFYAESDLTVETTDLEIGESVNQIKNFIGT